MSLKRREHSSVSETPLKRFQLDNNAASDESKLPHAVLVSLIPGKEGQYEIPLQPTTTIGRSRSCDIVLLEPDISTLHCQLKTLEVDIDGVCYNLLNILDKSRNGTFVNGNRLIRKDCVLRNGDRIIFGRSCSFLFKYATEQSSQGEVSSSDSNFKVPSKNSQGSVTTSFDYHTNSRISFFDKYVEGRQLGTGHYAVVKEAINKDTGDVLAVKIFHPQQNDDQKKTKQFREETKILMSIHHKHIVRLIERFVEPVTKAQIRTYLVLEKVNDGELFDRIVRKTKLRQDETRAIFKQLLSGLNYLHQKNIIHRDIKPENILLSIRRRQTATELQMGPWDEGEIDVTVKIADFGLAKFIGEMQFTNTLCGTPSYVAPEVLKKSGYTSKVDLWSAGVLLYVCLCGFPPFSEQLAPPSMKDQILQGCVSFYSPYWDDIDDSVLHLITNLLVVDPELRFDVSQTIDHLWFSKPTDAAPQEQDVARRPMGDARALRTYSEIYNA
ncbi:LAMI_0E02300g1_1 [Lachancea mirantina]|uniref:LAMI_0E02300g1_1 n=1 Tax=Lachancea mirantina TaxID=1230905 RepID=A0A1G4JJ41_9SACH|nr:LAMI_0E02300g1_1 [Lachancea mirantina]